MSKLHFRGILFGIVVASVLGLSGLVQAAGDTLVMAVHTDFVTFDPQRIHDYYGGLIGWNAHEGLLKNNLEDSSIETDLAESYKIAPDAKSCTFRLRKGIKFHDGTPFNAEAVAFSMERLLKIDATPATHLRTITHWKIENEYTITFYTPEPWAFWGPAFASHKGLRIVSPTYVKAHATPDDPWAKKWMDDHSCGTGPYQLVEWVRGQYAKAIWFPGHWRGWPNKKHFKTLLLKKVTEPAMRELMLKSGEADYVPSTPEMSLGILKATPGVSIYSVSAMAQQFIFLNCSRPPFNDKAVREAVNFAIDYDAVLATKPGAKIAHGILSSVVPAFEPTIPASRRDLKRAKEVLEKAGYKPGTLKIELNPIAGNQAQMQGSLIIQQNLAEVGIDITVNPLLWSVYAGLRTNPKTAPDMVWMYLELFLADALGIIGNGFTPDAIFNAGWINKEVGDLAKLAKRTPDTEARHNIYKKIQKIVYPEFPAVYLFEVPHNFGLRSDVKGFIPDRMHLAIHAWDLWRE